MKFEFNYGTKCIGAHNGFINDVVNKESQHEKFGFEEGFPVDSCLIFAVLSKYDGDYNKLAEIVGAIACSFVLPDKYPDYLFIYKGSGRELHIGMTKEGLYYSSERTPLRLIGCAGIIAVPDNSVMMLKHGEVVDVVELKAPLVKYPLGTQRTNWEQKLSNVELKKLGVEPLAHSTPYSPHQQGGDFRRKKSSTAIASNYSTTDDYVENQFRDQLTSIIKDVKNEVDKLIPKPLEFMASNSYPFSDLNSCLVMVVLQASTNKTPRLAGWTVYDKDKQEIAGITALNGVTVLRFEESECDKEHSIVITDPMEEGMAYTVNITPKAQSVMEVTLSIPFPQSDKNDSTDSEDIINKGNKSPVLWLGQSLLRIHTKRLNKSGSLLPAPTKTNLNISEPVQQVCTRSEGEQVSGKVDDTGGVSGGNEGGTKGVHQGVHLDGPGGNGESVRIPQLTALSMRQVLRDENNNFKYKNDVLKLANGQEYSRTMALWAPYLGGYLNLKKLFADASVLKLHDIGLHNKSYGVGYYAYRIICQLCTDNYEWRKLDEETTKFVYHSLDRIASGRVFEEQKKTTEQPPKITLSQDKMPLSFFKDLMEFTATLTCNIQKQMYTTEKKNALIKVLVSQEALLQSHLEKLNDVVYLFDKVATAESGKIKQGLNEVLNGVRYQNLLVSQFKEELFK